MQGAPHLVPLLKHLAGVRVERHKLVGVLDADGRARLLRLHPLHRKHTESAKRGPGIGSSVLVSGECRPESGSSVLVSGECRPVSGSSVLVSGECRPAIGFVFPR